VHIHLFGRIELRSQGVPLPIPRSPKIRSLLAYLVIHHDRSIPRDRLLGLFWPDRDDSAARRALSQALWRARRALGPAADRLVADQDIVLFQLLPEDELDVERFQRLCVTPQPTSPSEEMDRLRRAVDLYRADFLEDIYDDWALLERERLRELYLRALERLLTLHKQLGDYKRALSYTRRLVAADPLREEAHRELMRLYHLLGRSRAAMEQYASLRQTLADELGVEPAAATVALYREIAAALGESDVPHLPVPSSPPPAVRDIGHLPFVGRSQERARLLDLVQAAAVGRGGVALIEGEAGVGKTRLVEEIAAGARWRGMQVGLGRATPNAAPHQPLTDALSPLLTPLRISQLIALVNPLWLSAVTPVLPAVADYLSNLPAPSAGEPQREQEWLWEGLTRCLSGLATITPLMLILEDVHWADEATLAALLYTAPRLRESRLLLLLTCRSTEARQRSAIWEALDALDRALPLQRIHLSPFDTEETATLVGRVLGSAEEAAPFARRLHSETGGNALFLVEALKSLLEEGVLTRADDGSWHFPASKVPLPPVASLQAVVVGRLNRLGDHERAVLESAAVLGEEADFPLLSSVSAVEPAVLLSALEVLVRQGFLTETEVRYRFEHSRIREIVCRFISPQRRQDLHRRAGEALEALHPEQVELLALHFHQGGVLEKALAYAIQAGDRARAAYDYRRALRYYQQALALVGDDLVARWDVLARQEEVLGTLSRREARDEVLEEMLRLAERLDDPLRRAQTLYRQGVLAMATGFPHRSLASLDEAAALARSLGEQALLARCMITTARVHWRMGDVPRCQAAAEKAHAMFQKIGDRQGVETTLDALGSLHLGLTGDYGRALEYFRQVLESTRERGDAYEETAALSNVAIVHAMVGAYRTSLDMLEEALPFLIEVGDRSIESAILVAQSINYRGLGELDRAQEHARRALRLCRQVGNPNFEIQALRMLGLIALDRDDLEQARVWLEQAAAVARSYQQATDWAEQLSHLALVHSRLGNHKIGLRLSDKALAVLERDSDASDQLKQAYFERAQIVAAAEGNGAAQPYLERAYRSLMAVAGRIGDPDLRRSFLENVAENRAIVAAYRVGHIPAPPLQQTVRLPASSAPSGRPLRDDEYVEVVWTVNAPEDDGIAGKVARRRHRLLRLLREARKQGGAPTIENLAEALGVSDRTVKRDLVALRASGHTAPTRGSRS